MTCRSFCARAAAALALSAAAATSAFAQVDPLLFMKTEKPNVVLVVDTAARMQRGAPTDPTSATTSRSTSDYYDPNIYTRTGALWEPSLGVTGAMATYRRQYKNLTPTNGSDRFSTTQIRVTGSNDSAYSRFEAATRLAIARAAMYQAVTENKNVARFGMVKTRQKQPANATSTGPVMSSDFGQSLPSETGVATKWNIYRPTVTNKNGSWTSSGVMIQAESATANSDVLTILGKDVRQTPWATGNTTGALIPAGDDSQDDYDTPVKLMIDDAKAEVTRLIGINNDPTCRNTVVVMIVGGGEGNTTSGATNDSLGPAAVPFSSISGRRSRRRSP